MAVKDFLNGLLEIVDEGAADSVQIQLGIISFAGFVDLDFPMQPITPAAVAEMSAWTDGTALSPMGTLGYSVNVTSGWTNWRNALKLWVDTWPNTGDVDIYIFFTDGRPETNNDRVPDVDPVDCDNLCYSEDDAYFADLCNATSSPCQFAPPGLDTSRFDNRINNREKGIWTSGFWSDKVKATGAKLFMVGVGGNANPGDSSEDVAQLVTGPNRWDGDPDTFKNADYLMSEDLFGLGTNLTNVLRSICPTRVNAGAIAGGVIAGVVVAALIVAVIVFFLTRQGYKKWQASSAIGSAGANNNALFEAQSTAGSMPDV